MDLMQILEISVLIPDSSVVTLVKKNWDEHGKFLTLVIKLLSASSL